MRNTEAPFPARSASEANSLETGSTTVGPPETREWRSSVGQGTWPQLPYKACGFGGSTPQLLVRFQILPLEPKADPHSKIPVFWGMTDLPQGPVHMAPIVLAETVPCI